jgi:hypothetical protein
MAKRKSGGWTDPKVLIPLLTAIIASVVGPILVIYYQNLFPPKSPQNPGSSPTPARNQNIPPAITNNAVPVTNKSKITQPPSNSTAPAFLKVTVRVDNTGGGTAVPSDFRIDIASSDNPSPSRFQGSQDGTIVTLNAGDYSVESSHDVNGITYGTAYSGDCVLNKGYYTDSGYAGGLLHGGDRQTCIVTEIYPNFK